MNNEWNSEVVTDVSESDITVDQAYDATSSNPQSGTAVAQAVAQAGGTVDQQYNASSANAQSGTAVAQAIAGITPGTTYSAGSGINISSGNSPVISANYDTDSMKLVSNSFDESITTVTKRTVGDNLYTSFALSQKAALFMSNETGTITFRIPDGVFYCEHRFTGDIVMLFATGTSISGGTCYIGRTLLTAYNGSTGVTYIEPQDIVIPTPAAKPGNSDWSDSVYYFPGVITAVCFGEYHNPALSGEPVYIDRSHIFTCDDARLASRPLIIQTRATTVKNKIAVKNPLPAFSSSDAGKVLQVQSDGSIAWVTLS